MNKDCGICVYDKVCYSKRRINPEYTDCCIPEAPLRELQDKALNTVLWIAHTHKYIMEQKAKSKYWTEQYIKEVLF